MSNSREESIIFRVTKEGKEKLKAASEAHHLKLSQFVGMVVLQSIEKDSH